MVDELGSEVSINLLLQCWMMLEGCVKSCNTLHFLGLPYKISTDVLFLQSTFEFRPVEVMISRRASPSARYPKHSVSRISLVLRTMLVALGNASDNRNSLQHSLI